MFEPECKQIQNETPRELVEMLLCEFRHIESHLKTLDKKYQHHDCIEYDINDGCTLECFSSGLQIYYRTYKSFYNPGVVKILSLSFCINVLKNTDSYDNIDVMRLLEDNDYSFSISTLYSVSDLEHHISCVLFHKILVPYGVTWLIRGSGINLRTRTEKYREIESTQEWLSLRGLK